MLIGSGEAANLEVPVVVIDVAVLVEEILNDIIETVAMVRVVQASPFFLSEIRIFLQRQLFSQVLLQLNFGYNRLS